MKNKTRKEKELEVPLWLVDGFNGILALMIYNFILYLCKILKTGGFVKQMEETSGYFYLNSALVFGVGKTLMFLLVIGVFGLSFILGVIIGGYVRKHKK